MADAYPLAWPDGWPRTPGQQRADGRFQFKRVAGDGQRRPWTFALARDALTEELRKMAASGVVVSTNFVLGRNGQPREDRRRPADEGVAIYFTRRGQQFAMACDRYTRAEENMRSLALALDAMRQLDRHGGGVMMEKAFAGFVALPAPPSCWEVLGLAETATQHQVQSAFRSLARRAHPDAGGSTADMATLNSARDEALRRIGAG